MDFPATLIQRLREEKIVPFVGAGISRSIISKSTNQPLFPSWRELLDQAAVKLQTENKADYASLVQSLLRIDQPDFLQAAKHAKGALGSVWYGFLKEQFDHKKDAAVENSLRCAREVWQLGSKLVITTNYDRVLRWTCPDQVDMEIWDIEAPAEQAIMVRAGLIKPVLWHLHGYIDDVTNIILTPDGYERMYPSQVIEARFGAGLETLRALMASRSFLFIGFSLDDEAFGLQLNAVNTVFAGAVGPHYSLVKSADIDAAKARKIPGVEFIPFVDYGEPFFQTLVSLSTIAHSRESAALLSGSDRTETPPALSTSVAPVRVKDEFEDSSDTPPPIDNWVGRSYELDCMRDEKLKVIAVTGIGGQGKSTLVARYLKELSAAGEFWDWRDCKEESNTLHTSLVKIIERITNGQRLASDMSGENVESVIKLFFNITLSIKGVFVFDNIDQYVDVHRSQVVESMNVFIQSALKSAGRSRFIFTSRPKLNYESPVFFQVELHGLSLNETFALFVARGLSIPYDRITEVHDLTQGHPLWINLIVTQVIKNCVDIHGLVTRIKNGKASGLPNAMLREIWNTLNPKQQKLLRYLAEIVRPETEQQVGQYVSRDLNYNQFGKVLRQLKAVDLVVVKSPPDAPDTIELHPLIREFVRRQFTVSERSPYISTIIVFIDKIIVALRSRPEDEVSHTVLQSWVAKVELLINSGDYNQALIVLQEARRPLLRRGFAEEFVRLAVSALAIHEWTEATSTDMQGYDEVIEILVDVLSQLGRFSEAEEYISRFAQTVPGATARYVCLCNMRTHCYWLQEQFELAKEWGRRGVELKAEVQLDTRHDCSHNLALAQRDSGDLDAALEFFLHGIELSIVTDPVQIDARRGGAFYGNIGRCLYLKRDFEGAFACLLKSAWLLERARDENVLVNQGWAAFWLGELLQQDGKPDIAYLCFRRTAAKLSQISPPRSETAQKAADRISALASNDLKGVEDWQIERKYLDWMNRSRLFTAE